MKQFIPLAAAVALALTLGACATNETPSTEQTTTTETQAALSGSLSMGGASSQTAAQEAWRAGFQLANAGVTLNYDPTGSGTGRENFSQGGYAIAGSDAAFKAAEAGGSFAACASGSALVEIPAYISPIAVGFNLDGVTSLNLDPATIAGIFTGAISKWNDPAITSQNAGTDLPDLTITAIHRSDKSGTTQNFTDYLHATAPDNWTEAAAETWPANLTGEAAEKTQGVREAIVATKGAVGYLDASQATNMGTVAIKVGSAYQPYSPAAAAAAVGASQLETGRSATDVVVAIDRTQQGSGVYPLVLISYLIACQNYADPAQGELAKAYLSYVISAEGQQAAAQNAGSAPLTGDPNLTAKVQAAVAAMA